MDRSEKKGAAHVVGGAANLFVGLVWIVHGLGTTVVGTWVRDKEGISRLKALVFTYNQHQHRHIHRNSQNR